MSVIGKALVGLVKNLRRSLWFHYPYIVDYPERRTPLEILSRPPTFLPSGRHPWAMETLLLFIPLL